MPSSKISVYQLVLTFLRKHGPLDTWQIAALLEPHVPPERCRRLYLIAKETVRARVCSSIAEEIQYGARLIVGRTMPALASEGKVERIGKFSGVRRSKSISTWKIKEQENADSEKVRTSGEAHGNTSAEAENQSTLGRAGEGGSNPEPPG